MKRVLIVSLALLVSGSLGCALGRCSAPPPISVSYCDTSAVEQRLAHAEQQIQFLIEQARQDRSMNANRLSFIAEHVMPGVPLPNSD